MSDEILSYLPALRAFSRALCKSVPDAEDLVQETLVRAIENAHRYEPGTNMRAWLFTIMRNKFYSTYNKSKREGPGLTECIADTTCIGPAQEWSLQTKRLQSAINELPQHYREAIILVGAIGESYSDAARILDCDIGTIKSRVNRARTILRRLIEPTI